jgi:hypothetical protein
VDLYVMTHEHLDHVQGLPHAAWKSFPNGGLAGKIDVDFSWLTASAAPDYYDTHPDAKKQKLAFEAMYARIEQHLRSAGVDKLQPYLRFLSINNPAATTECVQFLRTLAKTRTSYVHRSVGPAAGATPVFKLEGTHPFKEARFEIWGPEEDTSDYYSTLQSLVLAAPPPARGAAAEPVAAPRPLPPAGVDVGDFYNLVDARLRGVGDNMLAIDKAANNTSVVFSLEWRGWRLLFPGDAELKSWKTMKDKGVLKPVHLLKVAHHGSHNGTPKDAPFDVILPTAPPDNRKRRAAVSTWTNTYSGIPDKDTDDLIKTRCEFHSTLDDPQKLVYQLEFEG